MQDLNESISNVITEAATKMELQKAKRTLDRYAGEAEKGSSTFDDRRFRKSLVDEGIASEKELEGIVDRYDAILDELENMQFAVSSAIDNL